LRLQIERSAIVTAEPVTVALRLLREIKTVFAETDFLEVVQLPVSFSASRCLRERAFAELGERPAICEVEANLSCLPPFRRSN